MTNAWAQGIIDMAAAQDNGVYDAETATVSQPTSFRTWCDNILKPAVAAR